MRTGGSTGLPSLLLGVLYFTTGSLVVGLTQKYCSGENTATGSSEQSIYQSNGHCQAQCQANYAFAVVQGQNCWCADYIPSSQESISSCNEECPGYPFEYCGSSSSALYGYIALNMSPSGTAGAASSSSQTVSISTGGPSSQAPSSTSSSSSSSSLSTSVDALTGQTTGSSTSSQSPPSSTFSTSTSKSSPGITPTPVVTTIVSSGNVLTVTSTPSISPMQTGAKSSGGISKGAVAGVVVAAFVGLAVVGLGLFFCLRRHYRTEALVDSSGTVVPSRMGSQLSRNGLLGNPFRNNSMSHTHQGSSAGDVTPVSPVTERRYSKPLVFDQRLNPDLMIHEDSSRVSITTMEDHRDYNRRLNITNPDPEDHE